MKKLFVVWCAIVIVATLMNVYTCASAETYAKTTIVVSVDYDADAVECVDFNGNVWAFDGVEDWYVGDFATMLMEDNDDNNIYNDTIVSVRYDGWLSGWVARVCK